MTQSAEQGKPATSETVRLEDFVVITGFSGAGKSTAMDVFEDAGYFCVDNLPPEMIRGLVDLFVHEGSKVARAAVVSDVRGGDYFDKLRAVLDELDEMGVAHRVLFLDAGEQTIATRYKETRRRHPLAPESSIASGIAAEHELLAPLKQRADVVIDTSFLKAAHLRRRIAADLLPVSARQTMVITVQSFGFKNGPARDPDLCFDVRFLPNPHYVPELQPLTGMDPAIVEYVGREGKLDAFYGYLLPLIDFLIPEYQAEGKSHLTVAVGCTGGRHRSVAIVEHLVKHLSGRDGILVETEHRDVSRSN